MEGGGRSGWIQGCGEPGTRHHPTCSQTVEAVAAPSSASLVRAPARLSSWDVLAVGGSRLRALLSPRSACGPVRQLQASGLAGLGRSELMFDLHLPRSFHILSRVLGRVYIHIYYFVGKQATFFFSPIPQTTLSKQTNTKNKNKTHETAKLAPNFLWIYF